MGWPGTPVEDEESGQPALGWPGTPDQSRHKGKSSGDITVNAPNMPSVMQAIDGDTLAYPDNSRLRLWGMDAPELKQQGWDRAGQPINIGELSRNALATSIANKLLQTGPTVGKSYGRTVAPVTIDGVDLGEGFIRDGNAFAAPSFLSSDPDRRFKYLAAERLARLNGLGVHDTMQQMPDQYRKNPDYVPDRQTIARFWDTPTPNAGMRPEVEAEYVHLLQTAGPDEIVKFVENSGGFKVDPAAAASWVKARDQARAQGKELSAYANYVETPKPLTDLGDGVTGASIRAGGSGFTASGLDELGAFADMFGGTPGRENVFNSDRRWADIWKNNQDQNSSILGYDEYAHPTATTIGQLGGATASSFIIPYGAGARTIPQLATVGGVYGGLEGFLGTDGDFGQRSLGAVKGAPVGAALNAAGGKAIDLLTPLARRILAGLRGRGTPEHLPGTPGTPSGTPRGDDNPLNYNGEHLEHPEHLEMGVADRTPDRMDIYGPNRAQADLWPGTPIDTGYPGAVGGRDRDWIDIAQHAANDTDAWPGELVSSPRAIGMDAEPMPSISGELRQPDYLDMGAQRPRPLLQDTSEAEMRAASENIWPGDVMPIPSNVVDGVEDAAAIQAGRFGPARAPNEREMLDRSTVRGWNGSDVPKVGPTDMVGWLRQNGGLRDQGGELAHMGLDNRARRGMDHVGQEARFGPLVHDQGMNLDDAALRAWEAGYFPDHVERPSINEFLDTLRSTHEGRQRAFRPEDLDQLDRYEGARADRLDLERQLQDGPVYQDRSVPADGPQPLPPVQAYEEWPAGGPDFAGNINLSKLDTPQDISRALTATNNRVGFDAATRGRVSQAETERLASELGMTVDSLLSRRKGQAFNAEEALAARQILAKSGNELVNAAKKIKGLEVPGDDVLADFRQKWMRHAAIQEQIAGITAEAGRTLAQFRQVANSRAVRGNVLSAIASQGGGRKRLEEAADLLLEAVEQSPGQFNTMAEKLTKPKWLDKLVELRYNMILSGPQTHVVNMVGNTLTALGQLPEHAVAAGIGKARSAFSKGDIDRVYGSELGSRAFGLLQGTREGLREFARTVRTGEPSDFVSKVEQQSQKAISGRKGELIRIPTRMLSAEDELFKAMARRMELAGLANRTARKEGLAGEALKNRTAELLANPTDDMLEKSFDYGRYLTFQRPLGKFAGGISRITNDFPALKFIVPFVRTPTNLFKFALERSPGAPLLKEWRADMVAGGARRDLALAKASVGTGIGIEIASLASQGLITGSPPSDRNKERLLRADGWQPYSFKIGDTYYSYLRMDPFATTFSVAADLATKEDGMTEKQHENKAMLLVASIMQTMSDKVWLSGVSDFLEAMNDAQRFGPSYLKRFAASMVVPAGVNQVSRTLDPTRRVTDGVGQEIAARLPGVSEGLFPKRDIYGEPITNEGGVGPDIMSPIWQSTDRNDRISQEMLDAGAIVNTPQKHRKVDGKNVDYTQEEYDRYSQLSGQKVRAALGEVIARSDWPTMGATEKQGLVEKTIKKARAAAREELFGGGGAGPVPPQWPGQKEDAESAQTWPGSAVEQDDVMGELQGMFPGISITSGYRTREYQEDMRRRGYHPAQNSAHLEGSSIDVIKPKGMTVGEFTRRLTARWPNAGVLPEGDHLHLTFPGWYGAPVLGGARGAGLNNPMAR